MAPNYHIGTSGWHYPHWRGAFYPHDLPANAWLAWYARHFDTVEINTSFYRLPTLAAVRGWRAATPDGFRFALKASRYITHMKKLRAPRASLRAFLVRARVLGGQCGPLLFQLPPRWQCDVRRLAAFLDALPRGHEYAFELRDPGWHRPQVYSLLRRHHAAFCIHQLAGFESPHVISTDFAYLRLHGPSAQAYGGSYTHHALTAWAEEIRGWRRLKRVYVYFDNDEAGYAVHNAATLRRLLAGATA